MNCRYSAFRQPRRGMLLLLVLLMLSLFMAAGAMLLTLAARARAAARANAAATMQTGVSDNLPRTALDEALMAVLRGSSSGSNGSVTITGSLENLLSDKYGSPTTAQGSISSGTNSPVMTLSLTSLSDFSTTPSRLNGRILTIKPKPNDGDISSYRILGATAAGGAGVNCSVAQMPAQIRRTLPTGSFDVVINGREFTPEAYDAYDDANIWLAQPVISAGNVAYINRPSFCGECALEDDTTNEPLPNTVDNDNDGVPDGIWMPGTFSSGSPSGNPSVTFGAVLPSQPSPLGGTLTFKVSYLILDLDGRINVNTAGIALPAAGSYASTPNSPLGMGYGPADVDPSLLFPATLPPSSGLSVFTGSGTTPAGPWAPLLFSGNPLITGSSPHANQRRPPPLVGTVSGRYGPNGRPGVTGDDTGAPQLTSASGTSNYTTTVAGANTLGDLQGRLKVFMTGGTASPTFTFFDAAGTADSIDDPYELRLDADAPRSSLPRRSGTATTASDDNPFTLAELELILRANDGDAMQLPQRLAAGIGNFAQQARMTITTDSWDTPGLTGTAAQQVETYVAALPPLNAATWSSGSNAVSPDTAAGLKFNINQIVSGSAQQQEFCKGLYTLAVALDPAVDRAKAAQWAVNVLDFRDADSVMTKFVYDTDPTDGWGLTTSGTAWGAERPELIISQVNVNGGGNLDITLLHPSRNTKKQSGGTSIDIDTLDTGLGNPPNILVFRSTPPLWRLRLNSGQIAPLADDSIMAPGATRLISPADFTATGTTTVYLERLADPNPANAAASQYVAVDEVNIPMATAPVPSWFHWANRPFISQAELALVPSDKYAHKPTTSSLAITTPTILDATYVPSRFAGNAVTVTDASLSAVGLDKLQTNQFSKWREPGKVNVNTMVMGITPNVNNIDNIVWTVLMGSTNVTNPFPGTPRTRTTPAIPGGGGVPATPATPGKKGTAANPAKSTAHLLSLDKQEVPLKPIKTGTWGAADPSTTNPFFSYAQAIRMANTATVRSQVFAIWITVQITDDSPNASSPVTKRLFAIVDRSVPVGYTPGKDLNVRDCIKIKRYLD